MNHEAQGQSYNVVYFGEVFTADTEDIAPIIMRSDGILEDKDQTYIAKTYKDNFDWGWFSDSGTNPYRFQNSYFTLGSMYSFINFNYGPNATRRAIYRVYEAKSAEDIANALAFETGLTVDQFLEEWSEWILSRGKDKVDKNYYDIESYVDVLTEYDSKWLNGFSLVGNEDEPETTNNTVTKELQIPMIISSQTQSVVFKDDYAIYSPFKLYRTSNLTGVNLDSIWVAKDNKSIFIKVKYTSAIKDDFAIFLQGDAPGLKANYFDATRVGQNTAVIKLPKSEVLGYKAGLAINIGERNFIFIEKHVMDHLAQN